MKPLLDCEFTAFISYAHADDEAWYSWVGGFRKELERSLAAMLRGTRLPPLHLSGANGPVAGSLSDELKRRVDASYAMVIVVHDNYAHSDWCLKELEYFKSLFGDQGFRERLYIVALSESAMLQLVASPAWQRLMPGDDQLWMAFFDPADRNRPLDVYLGPNLVAPAFRVPFERLRSDLVGKLRKALTEPGSGSRAARTGAAQTVLAPPASTAAAVRAAGSSEPLPGSAPVPSAPATPAECADAAAVGRVLLGFVPPASAAAAQGALAALQSRGLDARLLSQDAVFSDFADFADAQHLVLPFDDTPPMMAAMAAGGHLAVQRDAWLRKGLPPERVHWLDLRAAPPPLAAWAGGAAFVAQQVAAEAAAKAAAKAAAEPAAERAARQPINVSALAARLLPPPQRAPGALGAFSPAPGVRIYIESNRHEPNLWGPLGEQIQRKWNKVCRGFSPERVPPLSLRARGLPVEQIDIFPSLDDADGVVLLWGKKTSEALVAQINKVENKMTAGLDPPPGIVAYLMPPQQSTEPVPAWGWQVLRFNAADAESIDVVVEEGDQLERFLKKVFERRHRRDQGADGR